jgi:hypothetical protein
MFSADDAAVLGDSDCEAFQSGFLVQPVNAWSSVAYVVVGLWFVWWAFRLPTAQRTPALVYAVGLAASGVGSVLYHGPQGWGAQFLHDAPVVVVVVMAIGIPVIRRFRGQPMAPGASLLTLSIFTSSALVAGLAYVMGRTGSPLCAPDSWAQLHGMWHLGTAVGLGVWGVVLYPRVADGS